MGSWYRRYLLSNSNLNGFLNKLAYLNGEFWIQSDGSAVYADGDVGEYNHEMYVIEQIKGNYGYDGEMEGWDDFLCRVGKEYAEENNIEIENEEDNFSELWTLGCKMLQEQGMSDEELEISNGQGDARLFAIKNWGWKRLQGRNIETWELKSNDFKVICDGLYEAYDEDSLVGKFNIYVFSNNMWYENVPYESIERGMMSVRHYLSR